MIICALMHGRCTSSSCSLSNDTASTETYTLSLHDALPISLAAQRRVRRERAGEPRAAHRAQRGQRDRKSTRLNSSHLGISYAVFYLKKRKHHTSTSALCTRFSVPTYQAKS